MRDVFKAFSAFASGEDYSVELEKLAAEAVVEGNGDVALRGLRAKRDGQSGFVYYDADQRGFGSKLLLDGEALDYGVVKEALARQVLSERFEREYYQGTGSDAGMGDGVVCGPVCED